MAAPTQGAAMFVEFPKCLYRGDETCDVDSSEEESEKLGEGFMTVEDFRSDAVKDEPSKRGPGRPKKAQD